MKKPVAIITDIHGNLETLEAILEDIKTQAVDEMICLGDSIDISPNSKECIDLLIENNIKSVLGDHEICLLKGLTLAYQLLEKKKNDINLWEKYNDDKITYFIGHLHNSFDVNEVDGILGDYIEDDGTLVNIEVIDSAGCTKDGYTSYVILEISKVIKWQKRKIKYDREKFINKLLNT